MTEEISVRTFHPSDSVIYHIPRAALDEITDEVGRGSVGNLSCTPGVVDPAMAMLTSALLLFFDRPQEASAFFIDLLELTITTLLIDRYSDSYPSSALPLRGFLSPVQMRRVQEMLAGNLKGDLLIADIARECGLPRERLIRHFKKATGLTPYQWLQWKRVDHAKDMMKNSTLPLGVIAEQCGFADQSHLTRVFSALVHSTPGVWRQQNRSDYSEVISEQAEQ